MNSFEMKPGIMALPVAGQFPQQTITHNQQHQGANAGAQTLVQNLPTTINVYHQPYHAESFGNLVTIAVNGGNTACFEVRILTQQEQLIGANV